ncbi:hypothetical protein ACOJUY_004325 [Vibrio alginolyticus]|uniref:hypothetical protein n=1 Tax=Vibrio diabolicus TaxID=50719 RepID=UPI00211C560E|nr:hypothetical protein [Vibrio diabolicus]MCQ9247827.1 hypothetical protein [Vibrio diabolicus]
MNTKQMAKDRFMKKLIITMSLTLLASSANADNVGDFSLGQYQHDLDVLIPLASSLRGECLMGDKTKCAQSESLIRLIRQHAIFNPSGEMLSPEEAAKSKQEIITEAAKALSSIVEQINDDARK